MGTPCCVSLKLRRSAFVCACVPTRSAARALVRELEALLADSTRSAWHAPVPTTGLYDTNAHGRYVDMRVLESALSHTLVCDPASSVA